MMYRFHWRDGTTDQCAGDDAGDALARLGYGMGAVPALDSIEELESKTCDSCGGAGYVGSDEACPDCEGVKHE